ncbi:manganese efflux pump MntP family protein [Clostridium hydrogeniformans]|uniref:manganese efflux pump MntP n=1 Tax=Clostridium hydrogeniformans TaxID=349933 RepID=UPI000484B08F|nr:manganese efflux pump [Clostridium hydrogeniformans]
MEFYSLMLIAIALSLDAFGVALSIGLNCEVKTINKVFFILSFGFFQFFLSFLGAYIGYIFTSFASVPNIIGGMIISIVGVMMIKEGFGDKDQCILLKKRMYLILGVSVSIDALVVGFITLNTIKNISHLLNSTLIIGVTTLVLTSVAFILSKFLNKIQFVSKYADFIGGAILIIFGLKMILF